MTEKYAFITGITGQDGSYLAELLLEKNYKVYGIVRRTSLLYSHTRLDHIRDKLHLSYGDLTDGSSMQQLLSKIVQESGEDLKVLEVYNLGAQSHVAVSFENAEYTALVDAIGPLKLLEAIRSFPKKTRDKIRYYQAGTSEMFGEVLEKPQTEDTPFNPVSPYACAKVYAHSITKNYRDGYQLFACNGILFNHESPRRGRNFVTMKIVNAIKNIVSGKQESVLLGNIDSMRDWGHSKDYVYGMWLMLQQDTPDDYVLATGKTTSVRSFIEKAFKHVGMEIVWNGKTGLDEEGIDKDTGKVVVKIDEKYFRPCEVEYLLGVPSKAKEKMGWEHRYDLDGLIRDMFENEM
jgi:GDPmannose 4,6-dehydratase